MTSVTRPSEGCTLPRWAACGARSRSTPCSRSGWDTLELRLRFHNSRVHVRPESVEASAAPPVAALGPDGEHVQLDRAPKTLSLSASCPRTNA